jgi:hypothetical protein
MTRFYFDSRDNGDVILDEEGLDFPSFEAVKREAAKSLALLAVDVLPGSIERSLGIDVRNELREMILVTELKFSAVALLDA